MRPEAKPRCLCCFMEPAEDSPPKMRAHLQLVLGLFPDAMYATRSSLGSGTVRFASAEGAFE